MLYIFNPEQFSFIAFPNKVEFNKKYYYYKRNNEGKLEVKKSSLFWIDVPIEGELKKFIMMEMANSEIRKGTFNILLDYGTLYYFEQKEAKRSLIEKTLFWMQSTI